MTESDQEIVDASVARLGVVLLEKALIEDRLRDLVFAAQRLMGFINLNEYAKPDQQDALSCLQTQIERCKGGGL